MSIATGIRVIKQLQIQLPQLANRLREQLNIAQLFNHAQQS